MAYSRPTKSSALYQDVLIKVIVARISPQYTSILQPRRRLCVSADSFHTSFNLIKKPRPRAPRAVSKRKRTLRGTAGPKDAMRSNNRLAAQR